jgi:hypothetical protein
LIGELTEQVERGRFVVLGRTKDGQFTPPVKEVSGLYSG